LKVFCSRTTLGCKDVLDFSTNRKEKSDVE
jgi:hypothetical protein